MAVYTQVGAAESVLESSAVQMCARKVAAVTGDARKALDVCRRAIEAVESDTRRQLKLGRARPQISISFSILTAIFQVNPG